MRKITFVILLALSAFLMNSCGKEDPKPEPTPVDSTVTTDADAKAFITNAQLSDDNQKKAIESLVKDLKDSSLWTKLNAIYPFVGGTEASTKLNLKDPRDVDEAFRITYHGSPVIAATGVLFPTKADFGDTHYYDSLMTYNDNSISYFSRTENTVSGYDMGCSDYLEPFNQLTIYHEANGSGYFGLSVWQPKPASTKGLFMLSATPTKTYYFINGVISTSKDGAPINKFTNTPFLIGYCANADAVGQRECAFSSIGKGFTEAEAATLSRIVSNYQSKLSR